MKIIKNKSTIIILIFVAIIMTMTTSSKASFTFNGKKIDTNADLAAYAESNPEKFVNASYKDLLKKTVTVGGGKKYNRKSDINFFTSGCLYHRQSDIEGTKNKIVGVIDIDGSSATVNGEEIEFSKDEDTRKRQEYAISKMGYAIWNAQESKDKDRESVEKNAIRYLWFKDDFCWLLKKYTDIPKSFYTNSKNGALTSGTDSGDSYAKEIAEVEKNKYIKLHKTSNKTATIKEKDGKQFLGPFKVSYSGYDDVKNLTLTVDGKEYKLDSYYTKESDEYKKHTGDIVKNKSFYVKIVDNLNMNIGHKWKLKLETGNKKQYKAKIVLISNPNASGQNLLIWGADRIKNPDFVDWSGSTNVKTKDYITLQKVDDRDNDVPLEGVGFIFSTQVMKRSSYVEVIGYKKFSSTGDIPWEVYRYHNEVCTMYLDSTNRWTDNVNNAKIFYTDENGKIGKIEYDFYDADQGYYKQIPVGDGVFDVVWQERIVKDYKIGSAKIIAEEVVNPYYGYERAVGSTWTVNLNSRTPVTAENHQERVKLSGFVWLDKESGKLSVRDADFDGDEEGLNEVSVYLQDLNGNIVKEPVTTNEYNLYEEINGGEYLFEDVDLDRLQAGEYKIVFEYDGMQYEALNPNKYSDYGSKAKEIKNMRDSLNDKFKSVDGNRITVNEDGTTNLSVGDGGNDVQIKYNRNSNHERTVNSYSGANVYASTLIEDEDYKYDLYSDFEPTMEEIRYINLGLFEKQQTDYALTKDLYNVRVEVNGRSHIYRYATVRYNGDNVNESSSWDVGVKFQTNTGYSRAIYTADALYNEEKNGNGMKVYATYKIALKNESPYLGRINNIVDYCDNRMIFLKAGYALSDKDVVTDEVSTKLLEENINGKYSKYRIDTNAIIESGETKFLYVQFEINQETLLGLINNNVELINNVAEINSYTTFKDKNVNTPVAVVDKDSVPGNAIPGDIDTYEDDTDAALSLKLVLENARAITGTVFVDSTGKEGKEAVVGEERIGNGKFDNGETTLKGIKVELRDSKTGQTAKLYDKALEGPNKWKKAITETDENGYFEFVGFIPGNYEVVYTWGDKTYKVQYYKGTIYDQNRKNKYDKNTDAFWYRGSEYNNDTISVNDRYTDAFDDTATRKAIDDQMRGIKINTLETEINKAYEDGSSTSITTTTMDSITPEMEISVEYPTTITDGTVNQVIFAIQNVDFGIVERAKQALDLNKRITGYKITLANGQTLVDAKIEKDEKGQYKITGSHQYTTYLKPSVSESGKINIGQLKTEMDNELIEGATLETSYEMKVANVGELDYSTINYYYYGIPGNDDEKVTVSVTELLDYVDGRLNNVDPDKQWQETDQTHLNNVNASMMKDKEKINKYRTYLTYSLTQDLKPSESKSVNLYTSKLLTSTDDNTFDNKSEISEVTKNKGFTAGTPVKLINNYFNIADSEEIVIIPSTGDNQSYVLPIVIVITAITVLGVGIFLIKKFVID